MTPSTSRRRSKWWAVAWCSWTTNTPALTPRIANCSWPSTRARSVRRPSPRNVTSACTAPGGPSTWISPVGRTHPMTPSSRARAATASASSPPASAPRSALPPGAGAIARAPGSAWTDEPGEHPAHLDLGGPRGHHRIARRKGAELLLVLGLHHAEAPRSRPVQHRAEDDHLPRLDERLPVGGVAAHHRSLLVGHVERERRAGRLQAEDEGAHRPSVRRRPRRAHSCIATSVRTTATPSRVWPTCREVVA